MHIGMDLFTLKITFYPVKISYIHVYLLFNFRHIFYLISYYCYNNRESSLISMNYYSLVFESLKSKLINYIYKITRIYRVYIYIYNYTIYIIACKLIMTH